MSATEQSELATYIDQLARATRTGKMEWSRANPTTYVWLSGTATPARLTLQRTEKTLLRNANPGEPRGPLGLAMMTYYVFQATDATNNSVKISVDGSTEPAINKKLAELYEIVASSVSRDALDFLKSILPKDA